MTLYLARYKSLKRAMQSDAAARAFGCGSRYVNRLCVEKPYGLNDSDCWYRNGHWYVDGIALVEKVPDFGVRA